MTEKEDVEIGENVTTFESLAYFLLSVAFLMFYLGSVGLNLNLYIFVSVFLAAVCLKVAWERAARNKEKNLKNGPGYSERIIKLLNCSDPDPTWPSKGTGSKFPITGLKYNLTLFDNPP